MSMLREDQAPEVGGVSACIFDFGGVMTVRDDRHSSLPPELASLVAFYQQEFADWYHIPTVEHDIHRVEVGEISLDDYFEGLCQRHAEAGNPLIPTPVARATVFAGFDPCLEMVALVGQLRQSGYRTALLTNVGHEAPPLWRRVLGDHVDRIFDTVVDSSAVGVRKPDPRAYLVATSRLGVEPKECLFVDDLPCNLAAAAGLGMKTFHCTDSRRAAATLGAAFAGATARRLVTC